MKDGQAANFRFQVHACIKKETFACFFAKYSIAD